MRRLLPTIALLSSFILHPSSLPSSPFPATPAELRAPSSLATLTALLDEADKAPHVEVSTVGQSIEGRPLHLVRIATNPGAAPFRILFHAQQHGNEPAGREALLFLIRELAANPAALPDGTELFIVPCVNPDGAEADRRRNAADADLNRDHITLAQPETRTLHELARRIMPHLTVDCHEFARDSADYGDKGWTEWPLIMMDYASHPLFDPAVREAGERWVDHFREPMAAAGFNYTRYYVGGPPPSECRHSHPELDDARNGIGAYGGLSFIIESGIYRNAPDPNADLGQRVEAYLLLLRGFVAGDGRTASDRAAVENARLAALPPFIPTNYFWASRGLKVREISVIEKATGAVVPVQTAAMFDDLIVKTSVTAPRAYAIAPDKAALFSPWLAAHGLRFSIDDGTTTRTLERATLVRVEKDFDPVYQRYGGRTIIEQKAATTESLAAGTLVVPLDQPLAAKAAILLEPAMLYGLYQFPQFAVEPGSEIPVARVGE